MQPVAVDSVTEKTSQPASRRPLWQFVIWTLVGGGCGVLATLAVFAIARRDGTANLTPELFEAAHQRWQATGPSNYDIEVHVTGPQAALYRVEIRGGEAQAAWRNGQPLTNRRTFGTWSVPGMFSTISRDIEAFERHASGRAAQELILRADFDPRFNFPQRYRRIEWGSRKGSDAVAVTWDVTQFRVVE